MRRGRLGRAVGVTALVFVAAFAVTLGVLVGLPGGWTGHRVAVVEVDGLIVDSDRVVQELEAHGEDPTVRAVVVRIQSPGGVVAPTQEIHDAVRRLRERDRVVVASMGTVAASGGYYLAAAADRIVANPGTLTGSIGVIMQLPQVEGLLKKVGVQYEVIKAGQHKDLGVISRPMTAEERAILQGLLDDMYDQFVEAVAEGRRLDPATVRALADGRAYSGRQAKALGLVDELGGLEDAVRLAARLAGIEGRPRVLRPRRGLRWGELLEWLTGSWPWRVSGAGLADPAAALLRGWPRPGAAQLPLYLMD